VQGWPLLTTLTIQEFATAHNLPLIDGIIPGIATFIEASA
jgi:hypothetical protein